MKLLVCSSCLDILRIQNEVRQCQCGKSAAFMHADHQATITGHAIVLGLSSEDMYWGRRHVLNGIKRVQKINANLLPEGARNVRYAGSGAFKRQLDLEIDAERLAEAAR